MPNTFSKWRWSPTNVCTEHTKRLFWGGGGNTATSACMVHLTKSPVAPWLALVASGVGAEFSVETVHTKEKCWTASPSCKACFCHHQNQVVPDCFSNDGTPHDRTSTAQFRVEASGTVRPPCQHQQIMMFWDGKLYINRNTGLNIGPCTFRNFELCAESHPE